MKRILVILNILIIQGVEAQVSVFECYINNPTPTQAELEIYTQYYANCIELSDDQHYDFGGNDNNEITAHNFIHVEDDFHASSYSPTGKMHLNIEDHPSFDVVSMNYENLDWLGRYEKFELGVDLPQELRSKIQNFVNKVPNSDQLNPFLDWEIRVYAEFYNYAVSSTPFIVDGFYTQNYDSWMLPLEQIPDVTGQGTCEDWQYQTYGGYTLAQTDYPFLIRFAPPYNGHYQAKVIIEINGQIYSTSNLFNFNVLEVGNQGYIKTGQNKRFLKKGDATFYPIGMNFWWPQTNIQQDPEFSAKIMGWNQGHQQLEVKNTSLRNITPVPRVYDNYNETIKYFADRGMNLMRMIMSSNSADIEWEELGNYSNRLNIAQELDEILETCESKDIYMLWNFQLHAVLNKYGQDGGNYYNWAWDQAHDGIKYCYNTLVESESPYTLNENEPIRFFTSENAKKYYKQRLRYILSRWGYSTSIAMFELYSEINNSGFHDANIPNFYDQDGNNNNWTIIRDWQLEMAAYIKSFHNGKVHLLTASYTGHKAPQDDTFLSENIDLMSSNVYDYEEPNFNEFLIKELSEIRLNELSGIHGSYTLNNGNMWQRNVKPMLFSEMGTIAVDQECRDYPNNNEIEMNRSHWQSIFSGLAGGFSWESYLHMNNTAIYGQAKQFIDGIDFDGGNWHPGASELLNATPKQWRYKEAWAKDMLGKNNKADLMYLRSRDGNYAIGVLTNRTYNVYSVASCFDDTWGYLAENQDPNNIPIEYRVIDYGVHCGTGNHQEKLKLRGMNTAKYYINFFHPTNLSVPFHSTDDWGPEVEMDVTVNGSDNDYIVLFMARRKNYDWMPTNPNETNLEQLLANKELWENATIETGQIKEQGDINIDLNDRTQKNSEIRMYPNPGTNELTIELDSEYSNAKIYLASMDGKNLASYTCLQKKTTINVSSLEIGTYLVKIIDDFGILYINKYIKL